MLPIILISHHTPDLYGSDLQLLESVSALVQAGCQVVVTVPHHGPLVPLLESRGADIEFLPIPVLRKESLSLHGLMRLAVRSVLCLVPAIRLIRRRGATVVYVNTLIIPLWLVAAKLARVPALCHVHEAHTEGPRVVRALLVAPLLLAQRSVVNSRASVQALRESLPAATRRSVVVYNGVPGPPVTPEANVPSLPAVLALVARLSPRKGIDVALEATALLARRGYDVRLRIAGSVFAGYEFYERDLRERAGDADLVGRVEFLGYVSSTWQLLADSSVALVPSRTEPFGNTAVEAQRAMRPVVASRVQGLQEIVTDGETGVLVDPDDPGALAEAVAALLDDPDRARTLAEQGHGSATRRFATEVYAEQIVRIVRSLGGSGESAYFSI